MTRRGVFLAAALVVAADVLVLVRAGQNRSGPPTAAMELTERELRLARPQRESTALFMELAWEPRPRRFRFEERFEDGPGWFNQAKLEELGYDCRLPLTGREARAHYGALPAKAVFVVLEYDGSASGEGAEDRLLWSRLRAVDAGRELALLRKKYPDTRRFLLVPGLVRLSYTEKWDANTRRFLPGAYLRGVVVQMLVNAVSVPPSERGVLESLTQTTNEYFATPEARTRGPRYSVVLYYGRNHEPWIGPCRLIAAAQR